MGEVSEVVLSVAVAAGASVVRESLVATLDGIPVELHEAVDAHGTRLHLADGLGAGHLTVVYDATVAGVAPLPTVNALDAVRYLRPSRYCESDRLAGFARSEFHHLRGRALVDAVSSWVGQRVAYVSGSSRPTDGAVATLLSREGVCRDFAHLVVALLRACDTPARFASVYAPGLQPMDFHAVAEALVDGRWLVVDATCLAPRSSLLRIATGRDAADTAFLTSSGTALRLTSLQVQSTTDGDLPVDDLDSFVQLR